MDQSVLNVTVERTGPTEQVVKGEVAWSEVKTKLDETFRELSREVRLKGFRRGKVPRGLLDKMLGKKVRAEVSSQILREAVAETVTSHSLRVVTPPAEWNIETEGIEKEKPLEFSVKLEVLPTIEPKDYFGVEVEKKELTVTDEAVEEFIERERKRHIQLETIEGRTVIERGDIVDCDVIGKVDDDPFSSEYVDLKIPTEEEEEKKQLREPVPGLAKAVLGRDVAPGDLDVELEFDDDLPEMYAGKSASLLVTVKGLKREIIPALDDDFAKDTGLAETFDDYKKVVREKLKEAQEKQEESDLKDRVLDAVCEKNDVELSPRVVEAEMERIRRRLSSMMGISTEDMLKAGGSLDDTLRKQARREVHRALILDAVAEKENVEVTDEDVDEYLQSMAEARNTNLARLKADLQKQGSMSSIKNNLRDQKTVDLLVSRSRAKSKPDSETEAHSDSEEADKKKVDKEGSEKKKAASKKTTKKTTKKKTAAKKTTKKTTKKKTTAKKTTKKKSTAKKSTKKTTKKKSTKKATTDKEA